MLKRWFDAYLNEPQEYRDRCEVICVDDCGEPPAETPDSPEIRLYRVKDNLPWNQPGARNLAAHVAKANVLLLVDVDMTIPSGMLRRFVSEAAQHRPKLVLRPHLIHSMSGKKDATSPNVHLIRKKDFFAIGGYNEEYTGHKGYSDVMLLRVMEKLLITRNSEQLHMILHHDGNIPDAQVRTLDRDVKHNRKLHDKHLAICNRSGWHAYAKSIKKLRFEWNKVK
jgi:hypothetical protein